jgi:hypothetical protein
VSHTDVKALPDERERLHGRCMNVRLSTEALLHVLIVSRKPISLAMKTRSLLVLLSRDNSANIVFDRRGELWWTISFPLLVILKLFHIDVLRGQFQ